MRKLTLILLLSLACTRAMPDRTLHWTEPVDDNTKLLISEIQRLGYMITSSDEHNRVIVAKAYSNIGEKELKRGTIMYGWDPRTKQFVGTPTSNADRLTRRPPLMSDLYGEHEIHADFSKLDAGLIRLEVVGLGPRKTRVEQGAQDIVNYIARSFRKAGGTADIQCSN